MGLVNQSVAGLAATDLGRELSWAFLCRLLFGRPANWYARVAVGPSSSTAAQINSTFGADRAPFVEEFFGSPILGSASAFSAEIGPPQCRLSSGR